MERLNDLFFSSKASDVLNHSWFETLMYSIPGKITLAVCAAIVLFSFTRIMALSKPVEYK